MNMVSTDVKYVVETENKQNLKDSHTKWTHSK